MNKSNPPKTITQPKQNKRKQTVCIFYVLYCTKKIKGRLNRILNHTCPYKCQLYLKLNTKRNLSISEKHTSSWLLINSWWSSHVIWRQRTELTLTQAMAWCLTAPSHHLNHCWLIISKFSWNSFDGITKRRSGYMNLSNKIESYICKITSSSTRGQWVKLP